MRRGFLLLFFALTLVACGEQPAPEVESISYNLDPDRITVSGLSSGAHMATQLHLAHSAIFHGAAILAGGPYYCAQGLISTGLGPCLKGNEVRVDELLQYAEDMAAAGKIDALINLADDSVWIFHGALDELVSADASQAAVSFYTQVVSAEAVTYVHDVEAVHGLPTLDTGAPCDTFTAPFINSCNYDAAGEWLSALYGPLQARVPASAQLLRVSQTGSSDAEMLDDAFLYVPASCAAGASCGLHIALHGCSQSTEFIGDAFATGSGLNEWAESNDLLVLYPQVASSKIAPMNPYGCWDWWGYTNENYATRDGPQVSVIKGMIDTLTGRTL